MLRIKNKRANIPGGYLYVQRETNWDASKVMPHTISDFYAVAQAIRQHRLANPSFKLSTSMPAIEEELERVNVARIAAIPGATDVYLMDVGGSASFQVPPQSIAVKLVSAVEAIKTGKDILFDWEESGQPPVAQELANKRAATCVQCPQNGRGGLSRYFTIPAATLIKARLERLHELKMVTPSDNQLGTCEACTCPLRLKCWTPMDFISKHTKADQWSKFQQTNPRCWVLDEAETTTP